MAGPPDASSEQQRSSRDGAREALLAWYRPRRSAYPWRTPVHPGARHPDAYAVLVSEVMLQRTQAARVAPAFETFLSVFPDVRALAGASRADVLRSWGRLGYPRRAVALHEAAKTIVTDHDGVVPRDPAALRALPGVGEYTSAAIASLAFGVPVPAVDTNVRRIWARVVYGMEPDEVRRHELILAAGEWLDRRRPATWNQAVMDLGRVVCRPKPRCDACPLRPWCAFAASGREGRASTVRRSPFPGSLRQVRGAVLAALRSGSPRTIGGLATTTGFEPERVTEAVGGLDADGLATATTAALHGRRGGRVSLADG
ncbi:MAG: A/G-specific adenine glycosylase [Actinomycetota bacterium]